MSINPELLGKKVPSKSGNRPMSRERFASRVTFREKANESKAERSERRCSSYDSRTTASGRYGANNHSSRDPPVLWRKAHPEPGQVFGGWDKGVPKGSLRPIRRGGAERYSGAFRRGEAPLRPKNERLRWRAGLLGSGCCVRHRWTRDSDHRGAVADYL